jgi:thiamine-monophosphate kinase
MGEFELIEHHFQGLSDREGVLVGIGDDCAVVDWPGPLAISTDTLIEGVHFPAGTDATSIGHRCLAVNLSDLAAMGASPLGFTLALTLPSVDEVWLSRFAAGLGGLARSFDTALLGGDITRGPLAMTIHIIGRVPEEGSLLRSGAGVGDDVYVSGSLGGALAGLECMNQPDLSAEQLVWLKRFLTPDPRIELGQQLVGTASAAIDISDGLLADLGHLVNASGCGASLALEAIPVAAGLVESYGEAEALQRAACSGDEYELCFACSPSRAEEVRRIAQSLGVTLTRIGELVPGDTIKCRFRGVDWRPNKVSGYEHF